MLIMVVFNLKFGVMKPYATPGTGFAHLDMKGYSMVHYPKPPLAWIMLAHPNGKKQAVKFYADKLGNIDVTAPKNVASLEGLGFPIYDGPGKGVVTPDQLIWPDKVTNCNNPILNPYERRIMESLKLRVGK